MLTDPTHHSLCLTFLVIGKCGHVPSYYQGYYTLGEN